MDTLSGETAISGETIHLKKGILLREGGHINFGADPFGVGIGIGMTLSCLHNILLDSYQIFMDI